MIIDIEIGSKTYEIGLERITQFMGRNILEKDVVIEAITKYFSVAKYSDWENETHIFYRNELLGRKTYSTLCISDRRDLIDCIRNVKNGLALKLIKMHMDSFLYQDSIEKIDMELMSIYSKLEAEIFHSIGDILLTYERTDLLNIIQKSTLSTADGRALETLSSKELLDICTDLLCEVQKKIPEKYLFIIKNIDHLITYNDYYNYMKKLNDISADVNVTFLISTSLNGYCYITKENIEGITVFNDVIYNMPDLLHLTKYLNENYPVSRVKKDDYYMLELHRCIHNIGSGERMESLETMAIEKILNNTLGIRSNINGNISPLVIAFLTDESII